MNREPETINMGDEDDPAVRTLLEIARTQETRPTAMLLNRAAKADGDEWLNAALGKTPEGNPVDAKTLLCTSGCDVEFLRIQYGFAKQCFHSASCEDERMRGLLWYLLLVAAAAVHHDVCLPSQPPAVISAALLEVAPDLSDPWGDLLAQGAMVMD
jgi:hypothetical protein